MSEAEKTETTDLDLSSSAALGAACMLLAILSMSSMDAVGKNIVEADIPVFQMLFVRGLIILAAIMLWIVGRHGFRQLKTRRLKIYVVRALITFLAPVGFFTALKSIPLVDAVVLFFGAPLFMTALAVPFFKEQVGWRRWAAILVGFAGVIIALEPGTDSFRMEGLWIIGASVAYALSMLSARWLGQNEPITRIVFYNNLGMTILCGLALLALPMLGFSQFDWVGLDQPIVFFLLLMAGLSMSGHLLTTRAFLIAPVSVIAPLEYTAVIWSATLGYLFWDEVPGSNTWLGGAVIVLSGLYILHRERIKGRQITETPAKASGDIMT